MNRTLFALFIRLESLRLPLFRRLGKELWSHSLPWPGGGGGSNSSRRTRDLNWQEQPEKILLFRHSEPACSYILAARHWTRNTAAARHERYELHLLVSQQDEEQVRHLMAGTLTGSKEAPLCCGGSSVACWWVAGSAHGGIGETVKAQWVKRVSHIIFTSFFQEFLVSFFPFLV